MVWKHCSRYIYYVDLYCNEITEIIWKDSPKKLRTIDLSYNNIKEVNWKECPQSLTRINLIGNYIENMNWYGCPKHLASIDLGDDIININWEQCRNNELIDITPKKYYIEYLVHKASEKFIPYLPDISEIKKQLHQELEGVWWSCPNGVLFNEELLRLQSEGYFIK